MEGSPESPCYSEEGVKIQRILERMFQINGFDVPNSLMELLTDDFANDEGDGVEDGEEESISRELILEKHEFQ